MPTKLAPMPPADIRKWFDNHGVKIDWQDGIYYDANDGGEMRLMDGSPCRSYDDLETLIGQIESPCEVK